MVYTLKESGTFALPQHSPLIIGEFVDPQGEIGPVVIKNGTKLCIKNGEGGTTITDCFECEKGSMMIIK